MRFFDLVLALLVLAALVIVARQEFPAYDSRALAPPSPAAAASPAASPSAAPSPSAAASPSAAVATP